MGFENRRSIRAKFSNSVCFWPADAAEGKGAWGQALNLSESGMAFVTTEAAHNGQGLMVEFSLPKRRDPLRLRGEVVHCGRDEDAEGRCQVRVRFTGQSLDERQELAHQVLILADPKLAAASGWGKAYFPGLPSMDTRYRELSLVELTKWMDERVFLKAKETVYLKHFQGYLEESLGSKSPDKFKVLGSRPLKENSAVWLELDLMVGRLHLLAKVAWCVADPGEKAQAGLIVTAYQKDEAIRLEKVT